MPVIEILSNDSSFSMTLVTLMNGSDESPKACEIAGRIGIQKMLCGRIST